jgi:ribonuclease R
LKNTLRDRILSFLLAQDGRAYKTKELARELDLPKQGEQYQQLKEILRVLQQEGLIVRLKNSRWMTPQAEAGKQETIERLVVGSFKEFRRVCYVEPDDREIEGDIAIPRNAAAGAEDGDKVVVRLLPMRGRSAGLEGEVVEVLGKRGRADVEMLALARRYGLSLDFPADVDEQAFAIPAALGAEDLAGRMDLRETECFTIDPEDAKDFDDAVSVAIDSEGNYLLGVHIADVSHYVREDTPLDREALRRGTSVYLVDGVFPMLPERLSNHMCSLKEGKDRLTYSVIMTVTPRGMVKEHVLAKSVIRSRKRFSYEEVQDILDRGEGPHCETLQTMERLAGVLMKKRFREGSVDFGVPEVKFVLDGTGYPVDIVPKKRLMSMRMIEEFMLLANRVVAQMVARGESGPRPFIYRVHDLPDPEKTRELMEFLRHLGIKAQLDPTSSKSFQHMLEAVRGRPEEDVVQDVTIRSMAKAVYSEQNIGHFGLGFQYYTHFTSPIRRYPDLVVHRILHQYFGGGGGRMPSLKRLGDIARQSSIRERLAVEAERESIKIKQVEYLKRHEGDEFDAVISGVTRYGLYAEIYPTLVEGLVHVRSLDDYFDFDKAHLQLVGQRSGKRYRLGDRVRVRVERVDSIEQRIDFLLIDENGASAPPVGAGSGHSGARSGGGTRGKSSGGTHGKSGDGTRGKSSGGTRGKSSGGTRGKSGDGTRGRSGGGERGKSGEGRNRKR